MTRILPDHDVAPQVTRVLPDHAALRRYLVDERLLERDNYGSYRRPAQLSA